jgi:hypothetical protein
LVIDSPEGTLNRWHSDGKKTRFLVETESRHEGHACFFLSKSGLRHFFELRVLFAALPQTPRLGGVSVISFSNLGVLSEERLCFAGCVIVDAFLTTAVKRPPYYQLFLSTWRGVYTLSSCVDASAEDTQVAKQVLEKVNEEMIMLLYTNQE